MLDLIPYDILRVLWWLLIGVLLGGFAISDGFDFGGATLLNIVGKTEKEKRIIINTMGPHWEGNQTWLILGAGAVFAAWPTVYAISFSGLYIAMMLLLLCLIVRPLAFTYRSKIQSIWWKRFWDACHLCTGVFPSILFGVALGNVMLGVPFHFSDDMVIYYTGSFWALLNPFALLIGLISIMMFLMQGGTYLAWRTEDPVSIRSQKIAQKAAIITIILFIMAGWWVDTLIEGYKILSPIDTMGASNPLGKIVVKKAGAWMDNYYTHPILWAVPLLVIFGALLNAFLLGRKRYGMAFISSSISIGAMVATFGISMFPFILPSSSIIENGLTVWDSSSSKNTLAVMLYAAIFFLPIILAYTAWVFHALRGKVTEKSLAETTGEVY